MHVGNITNLPPITGSRPPEQRSLFAKGNQLFLSKFNLLGQVVIHLCDLPRQLAAHFVLRLLQIIAISQDDRVDDRAGIVFVLVADFQLEDVQERIVLPGGSTNVEAIEDVFYRIS